MAQVDLDQLYGPHVRTLMQRAERSLAAAGFDAMVIHAGVPPVQFLDDQDYPFKVNPHFKAWVPITDNPGCALVIAPGRRPKVLFHRPVDYWHKPAAVPDAPWTAEVEIIACEQPLAAQEHWARLGRVAFIGAQAFAGAAEAGGKESEQLNPAELLKSLHYDRAVKTPYELECMRRATALGVTGHRAALKAFREGASEYETHMRYLEACEQREEELPYNNIVAYNENSAVLHYQRLERGPPEPLRSFLLDAGAQFRGYASDITRTYAAHSSRFADLVEMVDEAQQALCGLVISGRDFREVHLAAHRMLGDVLHRIGLTRVGGDAAVDLKLTGIFFPHGIGHLLGLQVHDVGGVMGDAQGQERKRPEGHPYLRMTRMLEPGVVVTIEPGLYMIESLLAIAHGDDRRAHIDWDVVAELKPYGGVRIEDNVAATAGAPENMTRDAFAAAA